MAARRGLEREIIVHRAADLVNAEGLEALSLARLAQIFGVKIPSLYNHVAGLADLRRELALLSTRRLGERLARCAGAGDRPGRLAALADAYRAFIREENGLYQAGLRSAAGGEDAALGSAQVEVVQIVLDALGELGLHGEDALHAARAWRAAVHGFATLEAAGGFGLPYDCDESFNRLVADVIAGMEKRRATRKKSGV